LRYVVSNGGQDCVSLVLAKDTVEVTKTRTRAPRRTYVLSNGGQDCVSLVLAKDTIEVTKTQPRAPRRTQRLAGTQEGARHAGCNVGQDYY
jgi:hypothetical protein